MEMMPVFGLLTGFLGWVATILICALPLWRVTSVSSNAMAAQAYSDGLWLTCAYEGTGQLQCRSYNSVLEVSPDLLVGRALVVFALLATFVGLVLSLGDRDFVSCMGGITKKRFTAVIGTLFFSSGITVLVPVSWTASNIINNFFTPTVPEAVSRELGAALYIGWIATILLLISGIILCRLGTQYRQDSYLKNYKEVKTCSPTSYPTKDYV